MDVFKKYERGEIDLFEAVRLSGRARADEKKGKGAVYTPRNIVEAMIDMAEFSVEDQRWEPSCGHGAFVFALINRAHGQLMDWGTTKTWFIEHCLCTDISESAISDLGHLLTSFFRRQGVASDPSDFTNVIVGDSLFMKLPDKIDLVIGNPPYIRTREIEKNYLDSLRKEFSSMKKGNVDIYYAFMEKAVSIAGRCVLIVPNSCMSAAGAKALRDKTFSRLREVVDFGSGLPFAEARAYVAIMRFADGVGPAKLKNSIEQEDHDLLFFDDAAPKSPSLALSGVATLSDRCFLVKRDPQGRYVSEMTGVVIEDDCVRPFIKVTKPDKPLYIIYPYDGKKVMTEDFLRTNYPRTYEHFSKCRSLLEARDKGKTEDYPAWYSFGRSQGLHDLSCSQLIMVPTMIGGASVPRLIDTTIMTREQGAPLFTSGFMVPLGSDARMTLLSPEFIAYIREKGRPKPGAREPYFAISSRHINDWLALSYS